MQLAKFRSTRTANQAQDRKIRGRKARRSVIARNGEAFDTPCDEPFNRLAAPKMPERPEKLLATHPSMTDLTLPYSVYENAVETVGGLDWRLPWKGEPTKAEKTWTDLQFLTQTVRSWKSLTRIGKH